ncbi:MAG: hypothetical protein R2848_05280 [Thermomicrobiales bacterium]
MNPVESAQLMAALCDALLPGDGNYPAASLTGTQAVVANRLRERYGGGIFDRLADDLAIEGRAFPELSPDERVTALRRLEREKPEFFAYLLMAAYLGVLRHTAGDRGDPARWAYLQRCAAAVGI